MITLINGLPQGPDSLIVPRGCITFQLNVDATVVAAPGGFVAAAQEVVFQFDATGHIQPNTPDTVAQIYSNKELNPQNGVGLGTYYLVTFYDANGARINKNPMWWQFPQAANSTVDISQIVPFATVGGNVIFYPSVFGGGTVTSVSFTGDGVLFQAAAGTPVITSGTLTPVLIAQPPHTFLAGPATGVSNVAPTFRAITAADLPAGSGSVTSVGLSTNATWFTIGSSPITTSGTITLNLTSSLTANEVLATPDGVAGVVGLRALVANDIPNIPASKLTNGTTGTGAVVLANAPTFTANPIFASSTGTGAVVLATAPTINGLTFPVASGSATVTQTIANGTQALATVAIPSGTAAATISVVASGVLTTDNLMADFNADPTATTGYAPSASGMLTIIKFCTAGHVNFIVVNNTGSSITPGAVTLNWRVVR